jgi:XRE family aerobic/anaerobic benzoate catabolism transcriptional regulator
MSHEDDKTALLTSLGAQVRALRREADLTVKEFAARADLSRRFAIQLEAGQANISIAGLARVAAALGCSLHELIPHAGAPAPRFIALIGLRGAGKSTVGPLLAARLKTEFIELDALIEQAACLSLGEIFTLHGEEYYRRLERQALSRLLARARGCVFAPGGSLVTDAANWERVKRRCFTVWLHATPQEFMKRLRRQGDTRPMQHRASAMAELKSLLARREPLYAQAALTIKTTNAAPAAVATQIIKAVTGADRAKPSGC